MAIQELRSAAVASGAGTYALSTFFTVTGGTNPAYLVVSALDRNEYTAAATGETGHFLGNGATLGLTQSNGDGRSAGIVFTYQASTGGYTNATYGSLADLRYVTSGSAFDLCNVSVYGCTTSAQAQQFAASPYAGMQLGKTGYAGSVSFVTDPGYGGAGTATNATGGDNATPGAIAAVAARFVGQAWNSNGCWVLASTIAAEAGAGLPVTSTALGIPGFAAGMWTVAYNGPAAANSTWQSMVRAGDIVALCPGGQGGHIATCVSGSGSSAQLIDNITYMSPGGGIANPANDGSPEDILISAAHPATQEFAGTPASSVVIYRLDTPVVTASSSAGATVAAGGTLVLSTLVGAVDPAGKPITRVQAYTDSQADRLSVGGKISVAAGVGAAVTGSSLSSISLVAGTPGTDTIYVRAGNAAWWGDWQSVQVKVAAAPPKLAAQTPNMTLKSGTAWSYTLPSGTFTDPNGQTLSYGASLGAKGALPDWLRFDATKLTFSGTVPQAGATLPVVVTATDTAGLSATETFTLTVPNAPPVLAAQTPAQTWGLGAPVTFTLPGGTFTDPQGLKMSFLASPANGGALPSWLHFNGATGAFSGTAPTAQSALSIKITATDTAGLSASEIVQVAFAKPSVAAAAPVGGAALPVPEWHGWAALPQTGHAAGGFHATLT